MMRLKNDTAKVHQQLEKSPCFKRLFASDYALAEYTDLLKGFYGYYAAIEPQLFNSLPVAYQGSLLHRKKIHLLQKDLHFLGCNTEDLAVCAVLPELLTFAQKLGAIYVLEGSTLGGRVIGRHLTRHFGEKITPALHFYNSYGANLDKEWHAFTALMLRYFDYQTELAKDAAAATARATFTSLEQWLVQFSR
jgi:heme oxygenase